MSALSAVIYGVKGTELTQDEIALFKRVNPYGYIIFARNIESPDQVKSLINSLRALSGRERLPVLIDQEGGRVARLKPPHWRKYPPAGAFAAIAATDQKKAERGVYYNARVMAEELYALGITVDCAPLADLPVKGSHDVIGDRAFGHDAQQVISLAKAQAEGLMDGGVVPVLKHIPGHGRACCDSHHELPIVSESLDVLKQTDFVPFKALAHLPMGMTAHVMYTSIDDKRMATVSPEAIRLIREEIGFDGLLMSDDLSMKAMEGSFTQRAQDVINAGCDMILHCNGDMEEMLAVAEGVAPLEGRSLERAISAMEQVGAPKTFDIAEAKHLLDTMLSNVA